MENKKQIKTFKEFLEARKKNADEKEITKTDWDNRKIRWLKSIDQLYKIVDDIIVKSFKESGFEVSTKKESVRTYEEYVGAYEIDNYTISANSIVVKFFPVGTIMLPSETVKLVLQDWNDWRIVSGIGSAMKLIPFNEENIVRLFQENL